MPRLRILTFTTLYPSAARPEFSVFVENRLRHLVGSGEVDARVVAPVPWFPFRSARFGRFGAFARTPRREERHGIAIEHPRYATLPGIASAWTPRSLEIAALPALKRLLRDGFAFDLIDAHYFYPDGVAAVRLGGRLGKPVCVTGRGSDLNHFAALPGPRRRIVEAARGAAAVVTVSEALRERLVALGIERGRVTVLRNGVDLDRFRPESRTEARRKLGLRHPTLLAVGNLVPVKRHDWTIRALASLPETDLLVAGEGPEAPALRALARDLGLAARVRFLGRVPHASLPEIYAAADALVLASRSEGWPNVLLESLACGTPVVASEVGGAPEVVRDPVAGRLWPAGSFEALVSAAREVLERPPDRRRVRAYAEGFGWDATTRGQVDLFHRILAHRGSP